MFAKLRRLGARIRGHKQQQARQVYTLENSHLRKAHKVALRRVVKALGLEWCQEQLSRVDLMNILYAVGMNPSEDLVETQLTNMGLQDNETYTLGEAAHMWHAMLADAAAEEEVLFQAFQFFDKDGNGEVSVPELRTTMTELGGLLSEAEIGAFVAIMDANNDGVISYHEFINSLKQQAPTFANSTRSSMDSNPDTRPSTPLSCRRSAEQAAPWQEDSSSSRERTSTSCLRPAADGPRPSQGSVRQSPSLTACFTGSGVAPEEEDMLAGGISPAAPPRISQLQPQPQGQLPAQPAEPAGGPPVSSPLCAPPPRLVVPGAAAAQQQEEQAESQVSQWPAFEEGVVQLSPDEPASTVLQLEQASAAGGGADTYVGGGSVRSSDVAPTLGKGTTPTRGSNSSGGPDRRSLEQGKRTSSTLMQAAAAVELE